MVAKVSRAGCPKAACSARKFGGSGGGTSLLCRIAAFLEGVIGPDRFTDYIGEGRNSKENVHRSSTSICFGVIDATPSLRPGSRGAVVVLEAFAAGMFLEPVSGYLHHVDWKFRINQHHVEDV